MQTLAHDPLPPESSPLLAAHAAKASISGLRTPAEGLEEHKRSPLPHEAGRIQPEEILVIPKLSRLALDQQQLGLSSVELERWYRAQGLDPLRILGGHERQQQALEIVRDILPSESIVFREALTLQHLDRAKLVIALGGDNHFCYVAGRLRETLIVGMNSDPTQSEGAMTYFNASHLHELIGALRSGSFLIEEWTRLEVTVAGRYVGLALNDVFLGEAERQFMSRHLMRIGAIEEEQKGSGLLVVTGSDSHGWYESASRYLHLSGAPFPKTAPEVRFLLTEPYCGKLNCARNVEGQMSPRDELEVISMNDARGVVVLDSTHEIPFPRGTCAQLRIAKDPLKVVTLH